jgi:phosphoglycerol transferase MdoB-like AlkP superfamily enzyme
MGWLFFATKPSFMSQLSYYEKFEVLFATPLLLTILLVIALIFIALLTAAIKTSLFKPVALAVPTLLVTVSAFLIVDNFTYTILGFNVGSIDGLGRYLYALMTVLFSGVIYRMLHRWVKSPSLDSNWRLAFIFIGTLIFISTGTALANYITDTQSFKSSQVGDGSNFHNVLILSTDGLSANHMSVYGYQRETTPYIKSLQAESLVFDNHFSNAAETTGSVGSLLSGKLPTHTKVVYRPDIFTGVHAYQHLPQLLRKQGYRNAEISIRHYADPYDLNMREAFNMVNGRNENAAQCLTIFPKSIQQTFMSETYFLEQTIERIASRLKHAFSFEDIINPFSVVMHTDKNKNLDALGVLQLISFIDDTSQPFFAHIHFVGTHGPKFSSDHQFFSIGQEQDQGWMDNFYDDAILDFDIRVKEIVQHLKNSNRLEETLIIITSDHPSRWRTDQRVPLIIRYPHQLHRGRVTRNVQTIDIAPTILNYLDIEIPDWMDGNPLLSGAKDMFRPIFISERGKQGPRGTVAVSKAPFYSLGAVSVVIGHKRYRLSLHDGIMTSQDIEGHTAPTDVRELPSLVDVRNLLIDHLHNNGYDDSTLREM